MVSKLGSIFDLGSTHGSGLIMGRPDSLILRAKESQKIYGVSLSTPPESAKGLGPAREEGSSGSHGSQVRFLSISFHNDVSSHFLAFYIGKSSHSNFFWG